jgi:hypothetical protein
MGYVLELQSEEDEDEPCSLLQDEMGRSEWFFGLDEVLERTVGQFHDDADFPHGFSEAIFDLNIISFFNLHRGSAT